VPDGLPFASGVQHGFVLVDLDGDSAAGGSPGSVPGNPLPDLSAVAGADLLARSRIADGELTAQAWPWDAAAASWLKHRPATRALGQPAPVRGRPHHCGR
jgi:hypothetical protein